MSRKWTAKIEHWPHNGHSPHVMVFKGPEGQNLIIAKQTRAEAERYVDGKTYVFSQFLGDGTYEVLRP